jgi:hypothetical protein
VDAPPFFATSDQPLDDDLFSAGKLAAAQKFLGKVAGVQGVGGRVHGFGNELCVGGEAEERRDEIFSYREVSILLFSQ